MKTQTNTMRVDAPLDQALEGLVSKGYRIMTLAENAKLRVNAAKVVYHWGPQFESSDILRSGSFVREGIIYIPWEEPRLVRRSPILDSPREATEAHKNNHEFYLSQEQLEQAIDSGSYKLPNERFEIQTHRFKEEGLTVFAFGPTEGKDLRQDEKDAEEYASILRTGKIESFTFELLHGPYVNNQQGPFVRQVWFNHIGLAAIDGTRNLSLKYDGSVLGLPKISNQ